MAKRLNLTISGMNCDHCVASVERALGTLDGVLSCAVRIGGADVEIDEKKVARAELFAAVCHAGAYGVSGFTATEV